MRTSNWATQNKHIWFAPHKLCCLVENKEGLFLCESAFVQEMVLDEFGIWSRYTMHTIRGVKFFIPRFMCIRGWHLNGNKSFVNALFIMT